MTVTFDLPASIFEILRNEGRDPAASAKEAALVELYRRDQISHAQLGESLVLSRFEVDELLKRHGVLEDLAGVAEHRKDVDVARRILNK